MGPNWGVCLPCLFVVIITLLQVQWTSTSWKILFVFPKVLLFSSWIWSVFLFTDPRRIGKQFELTLLLQSVVMIITMFGMLHLCCTVQNTNRVSTKQHRLSGEDSQKSVTVMYTQYLKISPSAHHFFQSAPTSHQKRELFEKLWLRDSCGIFALPWHPSIFNPFNIYLPCTIFNSYFVLIVYTLT